MRREWVGAVLTMVAATAMTIAMAWPVLRSPQARMFGSEIVGRQHDAYTVIGQFESGLHHPVFWQPATDGIGELVARLTGSGLIALHVVVLASFPLACWFTYLLAIHIGACRRGAALAAFAYGFSPFHVAHAAYHPHIAQTQWLPLFFLVLWRCLDRCTPRRAALLLLAAILVGASNFYAALIVAVLTPLTVLAHVTLAPGRGPGHRRSAVATIVVLSVGAALSFAVVRYRVGDLSAAFELHRFERQELFRYSARWWAYLMPPVEHPLLGGWARDIWARHRIEGGLVEQQLYLGVAVLSLAAAMLPGLWRRSPSTNRFVPSLIAIGLAAFACSLSPERQLGSIHVLRPSGLLYLVVPVFRAYARFGAAVDLMACLLAALGLTRLLHSRSRASGVVVWAALAIAVVERAPFPPWRWHDVLPTAGHRFVNDLDGPVWVLDCAPASDPVARSALPFLSHRTSLLDGTLADCAEPGIAGKLARRGITHMVVRGPTPVGLFFAEPAHVPEGLGVVADFSDSLVLAVDQVPARVGLGSWSGFSWREYAGDATYRWMGQRGELELESGLSQPSTATVELTLHAYGQKRRVVVEFGDAWLAELTVTSAPTVHVLPAIELPVGSSRLRLRALEPASVPDLDLHSGDRRQVTIAVSEIELRITD